MCNKLKVVSMRTEVYRYTCICRSGQSKATAGADSRLEPECIKEKKLSNSRRQQHRRKITDLLTGVD